MTLRPLGDQLFIAPDRRDKTTHGLFLPTVAQDDACTGVVLAVGAGCLVDRRGRPMAADDPRPPHARRQSVRVGDRVVYAPERVQEIPFGYGVAAPVRYLLRVQDVRAVLDA